MPISKFKVVAFTLMLFQKLKPVVSKKRQKSLTVAILVSVALIITTCDSSFAHSGRTDSRGCHAGSKPYHCHNSKFDDSGSGDDSAWLIIGGIALGIVIVYVIYRQIHKQSPFSIDFDPLNSNTSSSFSIKW